MSASGRYPESQNTVGGATAPSETACYKADAGQCRAHYALQVNKIRQPIVTTARFRPANTAVGAGNVESDVDLVAATCCTNRVS